MVSFLGSRLVKNHREEFQVSSKIWPKITEAKLKRAPFKDGEKNPLIEQNLVYSVVLRGH